MITPRVTRLLRAPGLRALHRTIALAARSPDSPARGSGEPARRSTLDTIRDTLIVVPSAGAADQLRRTLEELWLVERWRPSAAECAALGVPPPLDRAIAGPTDAGEPGFGEAEADDAGAHGGPGACVWPSIVTRGGLYRSLYERLDDAPPLLDDFAREVLFQRAAADAVEGGDVPPFEVRPGLVPEMLALYDALRRQHRTVDDFERLVGGALEAGAEIDRGARRLLQQTRFLVAAFRAYEARLAEDEALDEHGLRARLLARASARPIRRAIVAVPDQRADAAGLWPADFDLLTRIAGLDAIDMVATEALLDTGYIERLFETLPGIEVHVVPDSESPSPLLLAPPADGRQDPLYFTSRDREQELADAARRLVRVAPRPVPALDRMAVVYQRPLPYLYLARQVLGALDLPWQAFDALPLAAEPYAAALDLVVTFVLSGCTRAAGIALLRAPQFRFEADGHEPTLGEIAACDAELRDVGFLGGRDRLHALLDDWRRDVEQATPAPAFWPRGDGSDANGEGSHANARSPQNPQNPQNPGNPGNPQSPQNPQDLRASPGVHLAAHDPPDVQAPRVRGMRGSSRARAVPALAALVAAADALQPLEESARPSLHLIALQRFLDAHERRPLADGAWDPLAARHRRARAAVVGTIAGLRRAFAEHGEQDGPFRDLAALVHRWLEGQTFNPRVGERGLHLVDVQAAMFGRFSHVALAGVVEGEWPTASSRSIFYPASLLRDLGWPAETERRAAARALFDDLLRLARDEVSVSVFALEHDAIVRPSPFVEDLTGTHLRTQRVRDDAPGGGDAARPLTAAPTTATPTPAATSSASPASSASSASPVFAAAGAEAREPVTDRQARFHERLLTVPALTIEPGEAEAWAALRHARSPIAKREFHGWTGAMAPRTYSVTGLDRYLQCPFKYFAAQVLRLEEEPDRRPGLTPMERGRFEHEVFQVFFTRWDAAGRGAIDESALDDARAEFLTVVDDVLARLPPSERALERARLLGSAVSAGLGERVFRFEAARLAPVAERLLEYSLDGEYELSVSVPSTGAADTGVADTGVAKAAAFARGAAVVEGVEGVEGGDDAEGAEGDEGRASAATTRTRTIRLRGTADRIDLLADGTVRVIDYKTGKASSAASSIQLPVYAHCAEERLAGHRGRQWRVSEAGYLAFGRPEPFVPVVTAGGDARKKVTQALAKIVDVVDRIEEGAFPVTPVEPHNCLFCGFSAVCRKDYVEDL